MYKNVSYRKQIERRHLSRSNSGSQKELWVAGPFQIGSMYDYLEAYLSYVGYLLNLVALGQTVRAYVDGSPTKIGPIGLQGHRNRRGSVGYRRLPDL